MRRCTTALHRTFPLERRHGSRHDVEHRCTSSERSIKIGVFGAGSIGCYLGGRLIAAGADVVLIGRPALAAEIGAFGLHLTD